MKITIGIDISKDTFDAAILFLDSPAIQRRKFPNHSTGFFDLLDWVQSFNPSEIKLGMESTGIYGDNLATFTHELGWTVFVLNPAMVKFYAQAIGQKNKTDRADCLTIARYVQTQEHLIPFAPLSPTQKTLRELVRERVHLQSLISAEQVRLTTAGEATKKLIQKRIDSLLKEKKALIKQMDTLIASDPKLAKATSLVTSIPGLGKWSAAILLSELPPITSKTSARSIAALFGLCPRNVSSGTSVRKPGRLGPNGRGVVRHQLFMPAVVAMRSNERIKQLTDTLKTRLKHPKQIIGAAMHHLVRIVVGVLKTQQPFDPNWKGATH